MKQIPNLFTLLNLIFGCIAIVYIVETGTAFDADGQYFSLSPQIWMGSLFIGLAALVDFFDGFLARLLNADSEMGKQLDSLADIVSFGVAPSLIMYQFLRLSFVGSEDAFNTSFIWFVPAFILAAAGAWRLARFNISAASLTHFKGVPIPAAGLFIASLPLVYWNAKYPQLIALFHNPWFLYAIILITSWLMVSNLSLMALKFKDFSFKNNLPKIILLAIAILAILLFQWLSVPIIFVAYIILSLLFKNKLA